MRRPRIRRTGARVVRPVLRVVPFAAAADILGAHRFANRLHRIRDVDVVAFEVRAAPGGRAACVRMRRQHGDDQVARAIGEGGIWNFEPPLPPLFVELARRSSGDVVDVGANTGLYSLLAAAANRTAQVHAVEASPAVVGFLEQNLGLNPLFARRVRVHRLAMCDRNGRAMLYLPTPSGTTIETSASLDPTFKEEVTSAVEVDASTLDDLWEAVGQPPVGLVKVDTEGTEHLVLRGMGRTVTANRPVVFCEVLPRAAMDELTAWVEDSDYVDMRLRRDELVVRAAVGFDSGAWNHAFVPREKMELLENAARAIGLLLRDELLA